MENKLNISVVIPNYNSEKCKVLLINPCISGDLRYGKYKHVGSYLPPYGLLSIAAVLEQYGHIVRVVDADFRGGLSLDYLKQVIIDFKPNVIGMTAYSIAREQVIKTAKHIKYFSSALLVVGGPHVMLLPEDLAEYDCFDLVVFNEGEYIMRDIAEYCLEKKELSDINGIIYKENGKRVKNPPQMPIKDLDTLPFPAFHLLDNLRDYKPMQLLYKKVPVLTLISGRGCPYSCIFCSSIWGKKVRLNSVSYVLRLIKKMINDFGIREIMFYEDTFTIKKKRINELCDMIIQENLNISWTCSANIRNLDKRLLEKMKKAGCWLVSIGIESGNDEVLKFIKKPVRVAEARQVCQWADEVGLKIRGFFMLGFPIDTKETIEQTINFAKSLPLFTVNFSILHLTAGSEVRKIAHDFGEVNYDLNLSTSHPGNTLSFVPKGLTKQYLIKMQRKAYAEFFLRFSQIWRLLKSIDSLEDIRKYSKMFLTFLRLYI